MATKSSLKGDRPKLVVVQSTEVGPVTWAPVYSDGVLCGALWYNGTRVGWLGRPYDDKPSQALVGAVGDMFTGRILLAEAQDGYDPAAFVAYWQDQAGGATVVGDTVPATGISQVQDALR